MRASALCLLPLLLLVACADPAPSGGGGGTGGGGAGGVDDFDDHTVPAIADVATFEALASDVPGLQVVKLLLTSFPDDEARAIRYLDGTFFTLHDEWYWFRLLNGARVPGVEDAPVEGLSFASIEEIYAWAKEQPTLPLDLTFVTDDRLYSPRFYQLALARRPRALGLASLVRAPARTEAPIREEIWAFELEYSDSLTHDELVLFFEAIDATTPAALSGRTRWLVRSMEQEALAQRMEAERLPYHDRLLRYAELAVPGETQVYAEGLTAGRLRRLQPGEGLDDVRASDVILLESPPDVLPPCAALLSAAPMTALSHVVVLARNRGIPAAYRGGLLDDAGLDQLARVRAPVIVRARAPDRLEIVPLSEEAYATWLRLGEQQPFPFTAPSLEGVPALFDLSAHSLQEQADLRPLVGGKSAGYLALLAPGDVPTPDLPAGLSVRPYHEHLATLRPALEAMVADEAFARDVRVRRLVLEGADSLAQAVPAAEAAEVEAAFYAGHPAGDPVGDLARVGGVQAALRAQPMAPSMRAELHAALAAHFASFAQSQGLRFRSSSNVEDVEGFNGAGLYDSNTGWLDPAAAPASKRDRDVEWAIKKTWSSYWSLEAFEERRLEGVDSLAGGMGCTVHANFPDELELVNGVIVLTLLPPELGGGSVLELDAQAGAVSVVNPDPTTAELPEHDRLEVDAAGEATLTRVRGSTLVPAGTFLLDEAQLRALHDHARDVAQAWLAEENRLRTPSRRARTLSLDLEFRHMAAGWPALADGTIRPARLVLKQARTLEPGIRQIPAALQNVPLPRDVLARARRIEQRTCVGGGIRATVLEAYTEPLRPPDLGYAVVPFTGVASVQFTAAAPALGKIAGAQVLVFHTETTAILHEGVEAGGAWQVAIDVAAETAAREGVDRLEFTEAGAFRLASGPAALEGEAPCAREVLYASPEDFLAALLPD